MIAREREREREVKGLENPGGFLREDKEMVNGCAESRIRRRERRV
jgi:hypothetical protein